MKKLVSLAFSLFWAVSTKSVRLHIPENKLEYTKNASAHYIQNSFLF